MSSEQDKSQKTEEPTEKKLEDARREGNTAQSREVSTFAGLLTLSLIAGLIAPVASGAFIGSMIAFVEAPEGIRLLRSEEHTSELQSLMRTSYAVFCLKK